MALDTLRFVRIQCDELDPGPMSPPFSDGTMGPFTHWKLHWLRLTADDGIVGQAAGMIGDPLVLKALLHEGPNTIEQWWQRVFWMCRNAGHRSSGSVGPIHALDMAMRDILAQRRGQPWHRYSGGVRDQVPVYGSAGSVMFSESELVAEMRDLVACGFKTIKMKVAKRFGSCMSEDVQRVRAVRKAVGDHIAIAVDANQAWSARDALRFARSIEDQNIAWFEEPVHSADRQAIREISASSPIPIAMGESENHWLGFRDLAQCGVHHLQANPHALAGYDRWRDALRFAEDRQLVWSAGGISHFTAMYVATRTTGLVEYLRPVIGTLERCWSSKPVIADGTITLPTTPGLPVTVDWEGLRKREAVRSIIDQKLAG